jgi:hypothetical protein
MSNVVFKLLGHDNPLGRYPGQVVPVGTLNDELVAIYASTDGPQVVSIRCGLTNEVLEIVIRRIRRQ